MAEQGCRILLVDDHHDTLNVMAKLLKGDGHEVSCADSVAAALKNCEASKFDVLVTDIRLPDGSGHDLMREVAKRHAIPGIALSGLSAKEEADEGRRAGFTEFLVKPISMAALQTALKRVMDGKAVRADGASQQ